MFKKLVCLLVIETVFSLSLLKATPIVLKNSTWNYLLQGTKSGKLKTKYFVRQPFHQKANSLKALSDNHLKAFQEDPQYACRFPAQFLFLKSIMSDPFPRRDCQVNPVVRLSGPAPFLNYIDLNPDRIFEARFMIASKGNETVSRFGHAMIHLVRCAPETKFGPDCRKDINHHVIVSYRGQVDELEINSFKGITGKYRVQPFFFLLPKSINEYTGEQNRDLTSYLLNFTNDELKIFIFRLVEDFWVYRSGYNFFNRNCATEIRDVIKSVRKDKKFSKKVSKFPYKVLSDLKKHNFISTTDQPIVFKNMDKSTPQAKSLIIDADLLKLRTAVALELKKSNPDKATQYENLYEQIQQQFIHERNALGYGIPLEGEILEDSSELIQKMDEQRSLLKQVDQDPRIQKLITEKEKLKL